MHAIFAVILVLVAMLLAAGCVDSPSIVKNGGNTSNVALSSPTKVTTEQTKNSIIDVKSVEPNCPDKELVPNSIIASDPFVYHSTLAGFNTSKNRVWIFGPNTAMIVNAVPNRDNKSNLTISPEFTYRLKNGTYDALFEYPDDSGHFNLNNNNRNYPNWITNQNGDLILDFSAVQNGGISGRDAADIIEKTVAASGKDRKVERITMNVTEAWIRINPVRDLIVGEKFSVTGTTNIPVGDILDVAVYSANYKPSTKSMQGETSSLKYGMVSVRKGPCDYNIWGDITIDTKYQKPDLMMLTVNAEKQEAYTTQLFNIYPNTSKNTNT